MRRAAALRSLSRDHHVALEHALRLRRAREADVAVVVASFLAFLVGDGERHFHAEEEMLLPLVPDDEAPVGRRLTSDHAEIRRRARALGEQLDPRAAAELGELLAAHVRFEERELFPLLERHLPAASMAELGRRLEAETRRPNVDHEPTGTSAPPLTGELTNPPSPAPARHARR